MKVTEKNLIIGGVTVEPGEVKDVPLFIAKQYDFTAIHMPVKVICGIKEGPNLFVCAAVHGDEVNGVEIIKRLSQHKSLKNIKGTLILVPIVNAFGFNALSRYMPDRRDLNRCFPGSLHGSLSSRLAHLFVTEILDKSTHGIDLHSGSHHRTNLPQIRACLSTKETLDIAQAFNVPVILDAQIIEGSLRNVAFEKKIPLIVYEAGESLRYDEIAIQHGLRGVLSVMYTLGMIELKEKRTKKFHSIVAKGNFWIRSPHSGIVIIKKKLGVIVKPGELLGVISDPLGNNNIEIRAEKEGLIIGYTLLPLVNRGDAVFHIATFERTHLIEKSIEAFNDDKFDYEER
jgi:predicted deacylase